MLGRSSQGTRTVKQTLSIYTLKSQQLKAIKLMVLKLFAPTGLFLGVNKKPSADTPYDHSTN